MQGFKLLCLILCMFFVIDLIECTADTTEGKLRRSSSFSNKLTSVKNGMDGAKTKIHGVLKNKGQKQNPNASKKTEGMLQRAVNVKQAAQRRLHRISSKKNSPN